MFNVVDRVAVPVLLSALIFTLGCGDDSEKDSETQTFFEVQHERSLEVEDIDMEAVEDLQDINSASAFRLYRRLRTESTNLVFSPLSISRAFSGYFNGVREAAAFEAVFGFTTDISSLSAWQQLSYLTTNRDDSELDAKKKSKFESADVYWVDKSSDGGADPEYFDRIHVLDLQSDPVGSTERINGWIEERSEGMLVDFLAPGLINADTIAIATNVVFFLGAWTQDYSELEIEFSGLTKISTLSGFGGSVETQASASETMTVVRLPYTEAYAHWVLMPASDFEGFANGLNAAQFAELKASALDYEVELKMPEFSADSAPDIVGAIDGIREETGTSGGTLTGAFMETYVHKAAIEVTKEGTRAAAATAIIEYENNSPQPPETLAVTIDKPFVHVIVDENSGSILFMGEFTGE